MEDSKSYFIQSFSFTEIHCFSPGHSLIKIFVAGFCVGKVFPFMGAKFFVFYNSQFDKINDKYPQIYLPFPDEKA